MSEKLIDIINSAAPGSVVNLPAGEFEGPVEIGKPLRIVGQNTTIWAKTGSVINITSGGVSLENLRVELTEGSISDTAVTASKPASINNVEVLGGVRGFGSEDGFFDVPRTLELGEFASNTENSFTLTVNVSDKTEIICQGGETEFSPKTLNPGRNEITLTVKPVSPGIILYTEVLFKSRFTRRVYLSGKSSANAAPVTEKNIYTAPERSVSQAVTSSDSTPADVVTLFSEQNNSLPALDMQRGQRVPLTQYAGSGFSVYFTCEKPAAMDIDPYVFLLDENEKATGDTGLVFFGNERSDNGEAVYFPSDGHIEIDLAKADLKVRKIALAYSVYAGDSRNNFSAVQNARVALWTDSERISFTMNDLSGETTVVALEFYLYKGEWKISAVGSGFKDGMAKLCNRYGIEVEN